MNKSDQGNGWSEKLSQEFIDYGQYFVPDREHQIEVIVDLLQMGESPGKIIELCCGEGLLAEAVLKRYTGCQIKGYDGSPDMLRKAGVRLERFGDRFEGALFDLGGDDWRSVESQVQAVVTSLAVHHLIGREKAKLFTDVYQMLAPGGAFIIADIIDPNHPSGQAVAAAAYDAVVFERSMAIDGNPDAYEFFQREGWNIFHELPPDDIDKPSPLFDQLRWLDAAGFVNIDVFWMQAGHTIFGGWKREENGTEDV